MRCKPHRYWLAGQLFYVAWLTSIQKYMLNNCKIDGAQVCAYAANALKFGLVVNIKNRRLAQLVRALGRHPRGQQFESATAYQKVR